MRQRPELVVSFTTELVEHQERSFQPVADAFVMVKESKLGKAELEVHCNRSVNLCDLLPLSYFWLLELSELSD